MILSVLFYVKHSNCARYVVAAVKVSTLTIRVVAGVSPRPDLWVAKWGQPLRTTVPMLRVQQSPWGNKDGQDLNPEKDPGESGQSAMDLDRET